MTPPETRYAVVGADRVAYHVFGDGPRDLVSTFGLWSNLNSPWADPGGSRFLRALSGFSRVIRFDRRGSGLSDSRPDGASVLDDWIEDLIAVLDAANSRRAVLLANIDSGPLVLHALDRHPERIDGLVLGITTASMRAAPGYPGFSDAEIERLQALIRTRWGTEAFSALFTPSRADDPEAMRAQARAQQAMASPRAVSQNLEAAAAIDARHLLPRVAVPTLVIGRRDCRMFPLAQSRYMAEHIPGAQWLELPGADANIAGEGVTESLSAIEALITGERRRVRRAGQLASMLFTDIVAATRMANDLGNRDWRERLDAHDRLVRLQANLHGGVLVDSAGDGSFSALPTLPTPLTARRRCMRSCSRCSSTSVPGCIWAMWSCAMTAASVACRCTSARAWRHWPIRAKPGCRAPCATYCSDRTTGFRSGAFTASRASPASGRCTGFDTMSTTTQPLTPRQKKGRAAPFLMTCRRLLETR